MKRFAAVIALAFSLLPGLAGAQVLFKNLPASAGIGTADFTVDDQAGTTKKATYAQVATFIGANLPAGSVTLAAQAALAAYSVQGNATGSTAAVTALTTPELFGLNYINTTANANAKVWKENITVATGAPTLHGQACTDAPVCTDWLQVTRTDGANPGVADNINLVTSSGGFETSVRINPDSLVLTSNGDPTSDQINCTLGFGDFDCVANINADTLMTYANQASGTHAYSHIQLSANTQFTEFDMYPSSYTDANACGLAAGTRSACWVVGTSGLIGIKAGGGYPLILGADGFTNQIAAAATTDTTGFFYVDTVAGVPTGVPVATAPFNIAKAMRYDSTDNRLYVYNSGWKDVADAPTAPVLVGTTASIGGSILVAGACSSGTVAVTGSTTAMAVAASPVTYPGDGNTWMGYVSTAGTVTVKVCALVGGTPGASAYNVRVLQ